jgi:hypothetical protein
MSLPGFTFEATKRREGEKKLLPSSWDLGIQRVCIKNAMAGDTTVFYFFPFKSREEKLGVNVF